MPYVLCTPFFLERFSKLVEPTLRQWNRSKNPWKRRASVVSTIYYASKKERHHLDKWSCHSLNLSSRITIHTSKKA